MENVVKQIYASANIADSDQSIHKVLDIKNAIPNSKLISKDVRTTIVKNVLGAVGIDEVKLIDDADIRSKALKEELDKAMASISEVTQISKQSIAELEAQIREIRNDTSAKQLEFSKYRREIDDELNKIISAVQILTTI